MKKPYHFFAFTVLLAAMYAEASAQIVTDSELITMFVDGYVVKTDQDTLRGKVMVTQQNNYATQISFKDKDGNKTKYGADDIIAFGQKRPKLMRDFTDLTTVDKEQVHYESKAHPKKEGKLVFMERLMDGNKIKLYNNPSGGEGSTSIGGFKLNENEASYVVVKQGGKPFILKKKNYEDEFDSLFGDCSDFMASAKSKPEWKKFKQLGTVVETYNKSCQ